MIQRLKSFIRKVKRLIDFLPVIWNGYDFDYVYSLELFKHQLQRTADLLESDQAYGLFSKHHASRIRTAIRLMQKVYDGDYEDWSDKLVAEYGEGVLEYHFEDCDLDGEEFGEPGEKLSKLVSAYENWDNAEEISARISELIKESVAQHRKAERILWQFIAHNIKYWWD